MGFKSAPFLQKELYLDGLRWRRFKNHCIYYDFAIFSDLRFRSRRYGIFEQQIEIDKPLVRVLDLRILKAIAPPERHVQRNIMIVKSMYYLMHFSKHCIDVC